MLVRATETVIKHIEHMMSCSSEGATVSQPHCSWHSGGISDRLAVLSLGLALLQLLPLAWVKLAQYSGALRPRNPSVPSSLGL